jgi:hypothetical protein
VELLTHENTSSCLANASELEMPFERPFYVRYKLVTRLP